MQYQTPLGSEIEITQLIQRPHNMQNTIQSNSIYNVQVDTVNVFMNQRINHASNSHQTYFERGKAEIEDRLFHTNNLQQIFSSADRFSHEHHAKRITGAKSRTDTSVPKSAVSCIRSCDRQKLSAKKTIATPLDSESEFGENCELQGSIHSLMSSIFRFFRRL